MSGLLKAALAGNLKKVKLLVRSGADVNERVYNTTALHCAAQSGSLDVLKYLVQNGADISCKNWSGETVLHYAARFGFLEVVEYLVEHGASVTSEDSSACCTVLWSACAGGNDVIVEYLFHHGAKRDINDPNISPLHVACMLGYTAVVQTLLKYDVDLRKQKTLICCNDEIINILRLELKKSIKHREKIEMLTKMDEEKVEQVLKCCTSEKSLCLGKGCKGTSVYVGVMQDGIEVAVKRMLIQSCEDSARNEKIILCRTDTGKSPFIVSYRQFYQDEIFMYIILDLCEETLKEHVHSQTPETLKKQGPRMIKEILTGLEFIHSRGILHRDLKPTNVLVDVDGHMRLADFGISRVLNEDETTVETDAKGTQDWIPVEVIEAINKQEKCRFKKKSDVQVASMICFFILTKGKHPFGSSLGECMMNIAKGEPVNLDQLPNLDARQFLAWLISHSIDERPYASEALRHPILDKVEEYGRLEDILLRQGHFQVNK